jgi:activator of HSP90 ATPase
LSLDPPNNFVQSWKLKNPNWPSGSLATHFLVLALALMTRRYADHEGKLTTTLDQQDDYTKLVLELSGVPKGQEDEIEKNLIGY